MPNCSSCNKKHLDIWFPEYDQDYCDKCYLALPITKKGK